MKKWALVNKETGVVVAKGVGPSNLSPPQEDNCYLIHDFPDWVESRRHKLKNNEFVEDQNYLSRDVRRKRNSLLFIQIDPIVTNPLRWEHLSQQQQQAIKDYRQELLDITDQPNFPNNVQWPKKPDFI